MKGRAARIAFERGGLLGIAVLALYVWLAPTRVVDGDNAEFATLGALGGAAHPPGYPLYVLWLRAMSWLPGASPAHNAAIATAILGAASIVVMHAACRAWGARPLAATLACALFAGAPVVMTLYTEAEVFALNGLVVATLLWLAADRGPLRGARRLFALGLVAGLGLANHHTCVLVAPVGLYGAWRGVREASWRAVPFAVLGVALGLVPYLYLVTAPVHAGTWGDIHGLSGIVDMFMRRDYGGPGAFSAKDEHVTLAQSLGALAATLGRTWWWLGALGGLIAAAARAVRPSSPDHEPRIGWVMLLASFVLAGPLLASRFNVSPEGVGAYVVHRFHILPALLLAVPVADAFDRAGSWLAARVRAVPQAAAGAVGVLGLAAFAAPSLSHVAHVHAPAVEWQHRNTLASLPYGSVVIGFDDDVGFTVVYLQLACGMRPDVDDIQKPMLSLDWYTRRVAERGFALDGIIDGVLARHRPVFVQPRNEVLSQLSTYPFGVLSRVLPRGAARPPLDDILAMNKQWYEQLELPYPTPGRDDEWPTRVHERYAFTWQELARALDAARRPNDAALARELAARIGPQ